MINNIYWACYCNCTAQCMILLHLWRFKTPILMKIYYLYFFNFLLDFLDGFLTYTASLLYEPINKFL